MKNKDNLFAAVRLLDEIIADLMTANISAGGKSSSRLLLIRLRRLRYLLGQCNQRNRSLDPVIIGVMLREAVRLVAEMINNIQYKIRSLRSEHEGLDRATWVRVEVLSAKGWDQTEGVGSSYQNIGVTAVAY